MCYKFNYTFIKFYLVHKIKLVQLRTHLYILSSLMLWIYRFWFLFMDIPLCSIKHLWSSQYSLTYFKFVLSVFLIILQFRYAEIYFDLTFVFKKKLWCKQVILFVYYSCTNTVSQKKHFLENFFSLSTLQVIKNILKLHGKFFCFPQVNA